MVNAIKLISVNRGLDPRDFTLIAFGGGGGMHACALAAELGIKKVVIPSLSGVFSAWGMLLSDLRRDYLQTQIVDLSDAQAAADVNEAFAALEEEAIRAVRRGKYRPGRVHFLRYGALPLSEPGAFGGDRPARGRNHCGAVSQPFASTSTPTTSANTPTA